MKKILVISQKELVKNPIFKQDKNLVEIFDLLTKENEVQLLYLHKNMKNEKDVIDIENKFNDITMYSLRDMMQKNSLKKNLTDFIEQNKFDTIIFMSYYMAQLVIPYIEDIIDMINIIVDFRLSPLGYVLQQYKDEKEKSYQNFYPIYKDFKLKFLQSIAILQNSDYLILDKDLDLSFLKKEKIENVISITDLNSVLEKKEKIIKNPKTVLISVNSDNFASKNVNLGQSNNNNTTYVINDSKYLNLIDNINNIIFNSDADYFFIHNAKLNILPDTFKIISKYLQFNDNIAVASPVVMYVKDNMQMQMQVTFSDQRNNNFANWEESSPLLFSDCFAVKKTFINKLGYLDNKFKTLNYALFDFILRLYQVNAYYCTMKDISVFKSMAIKRPISLFQDDKIYLCSKWRELSFNMEA